MSQQRVIDLFRKLQTHDGFPSKPVAEKSERDVALKILKPLHTSCALKSLARWNAMLYRSCRNEKNNVLPLTKGFIYPWHQKSEHYLVCHLLCILYIQLMKCLNMVRGESDGNQKDVLFPFLCEALNGIFCLRTQPWHGTYLQKNNNQN